MAGILMPENAPMRLLPAVQLHACIANAEGKLGSSELERQAITTRLDKRLLKTPELAKVVLLSS